MSEFEEVSPNLGSINTRWSMVRQAHKRSDSGDSGSQAREALVMQYASAIRKFVFVVVKDDHLADELAQDAIVRLLKGDFSGADPNRGRFRDLLKTAIRNMARNTWNKNQRRSSVALDLQLIDSSESDELDELWTKECRDLFLSNAWKNLEEWEAANPGSVAFTLLRLRSQYPDDSSDQVAQRLSEEKGKTYNSENTRQQLRRARVRFAEYLVTEIADGLGDPTPENLKEELVLLGLYSSVRDVLPAEWKS